MTGGLSEWEFFEGYDAWVKRFPEIRAWMSALGDYTAGVYSRKWYRFHRWLFNQDVDPRFAGLGPGELLDLQEKVGGRRERYAQVRVIQFYVNNVLKGAKASKIQFMTALRSFYVRSYVPLPSDPNFRIQAESEPVTGFLRREEAREIALKANRKYRAVFCLQVVGFMGFREFNIFNTSDDARECVLSGHDVVRVHFSGRKRVTRPYYTLVGGDGLKYLREYLEHDRGRIRPGEPMIIGQNNESPLGRNAIRTTMTRLSADLGFIDILTPPCPDCGGKTRKRRLRVVENDSLLKKIHYECLSCGKATRRTSSFEASKSTRYRIKPHEFGRDLAKSLWFRSGTPEKWMADFFMGHLNDVDPNDYQKAMKIWPDWVEETYRENLPWLNILSEDPEKVPRERVDHQDRKIVELEERLQQQGRVLEAIQRAQKLGLIRLGE